MTMKYDLSRQLIAECEGLRLHAYQDSVGIWTIGIGTTRKPGDIPVKQGDCCTKEEAEEWLQYHLENTVFPAVNILQSKYLFNDRIYAALCSLSYNIGDINKPSIILALRQTNINQLAAAFRKFTKAGGKISKGLMDRREIEIRFFSAGD